jgi:ketol-acid reductoisomerase
MAELLRERDCDPSILKPKTIAVIGYGAQGEAQALNLRESGFKVVVGLYEGSPSWRRAEGAGLTVMTAAEAAKAADFIMVLAREEHHGKLWREALARGVTKGKTLASPTASASISGKSSRPRASNVVLVSPKGSGRLVRSAFLEGRGVPCLVAIHQDATGDAAPCPCLRGRHRRFARRGPGDERPRGDRDRPVRSASPARRRHRGPDQDGLRSSRGSGP